MIRRVITNVGRLGLAAANDAPCAAITRTWGFHRVFTVITPFLRGQQTFAVAKHHTVFIVGEGATLVNSLKSVPALGWQFGD